jgi:hypothetical protein
MAKTGFGEYITFAVVLRRFLFIFRSLEGW